MVGTRQYHLWGQGSITWRHDSVLFAVFHIVYRTVLPFKKEHQQVKLGVSEQEVNETIQFKSESNVKYPAVRMPVRKEILAEAADWGLQFDMATPAYNQIKE